METWASVPDGTVGTMKVLEMDGPGGGWRVLVPETRRERMRGLRGHRSLSSREAMFFRRCRGVHTIGMREPISVLFLDGVMRVIEVRRVRPGRLVWAPHRRARHVLECDVGVALRIGDRLRPGAPAAR